MSEAEMKDTVEFVSVQATGIMFSLTNIDAYLRTGILIATLVYGVFKIIKIYQDINAKKK